MAAAAELSAMATILLTFIWGWQGRFPGSWLVLLFLYFGVAVASHARRHETPAQLGLRMHNVQPALRNAASVVVPISAVALATGAALGTWHFPSWERSLAGLPWLLTWAAAQQYGLLCFFYRGFLEILEQPLAATVATSVTFAVFHAPNGFLMAVTLGAGVIACTLYRRLPNVFVIAIVHAALSYVIYYSLPSSLTHGFRVGPGY
jgi:hypothetical protein